MAVVFPFEEQKTSIFGVIKRPVADVDFWSVTLEKWIPVRMVVDTGADYTLLPKWIAGKLGVDLGRDCRKYRTAGVGGEEEVFLLRGEWKAKIGEWEESVVLGFIGDNNVPPLLGRLKFMEKFKVTFNNYRTLFEK